MWGWSIVVGRGGVEHQGTSVEKIGIVMAVWHRMVVQAGVWKRVKGWLDTRVDRRMGPHLDSCAPIPCNVQLEQGKHGAASMSEGQ